MAIKKLIDKNDVISVRVDSKVKNKLAKMAIEAEREFSDYVRLLLTKIADGKIETNI